MYIEECTSHFCGVKYLANVNLVKLLYGVCQLFDIPGTFLSSSSINYWKNFQGLQWAPWQEVLCLLGCPSLIDVIGAIVGCVHAWDCYVFLMDWPFLSKSLLLFFNNGVHIVWLHSYKNFIYLSIYYFRKSKL